MRAFWLLCLLLLVLPGCGAGGGSGEAATPQLAYVERGSREVVCPALASEGPRSCGTIGVTHPRPGSLQLPASPANDLGVRAFNRAWRMHALLTADAVFLGDDLGAASREPAFLSFRKGRDRLVRVAHVFMGPRDLEGRTVRVRLPSGAEATSTKGAWIHVIGGESRYGMCAFSRGPKPASRPLLDQRFLPIRMVRSADEMAAVVADLRAGASLPIIRDRDEPDGPGVREIVFGGTVDEALLALDCEDGRAAGHAARSLVLRPEAARAAVVSELQRRLFDTTQGTHRHHLKTKRLIRILGQITSGAPGGLLDAMIQDWMAFLDAGDERPGAGSLRDARTLESACINRSLAWLLGTLDPATARARHGARLLALVEAAHGAWRREVQLIVAELQIREALELPRALERSRVLGRVARDVEFREPPDPAAHAEGQHRLVVRSADGNWQVEVEGCCKGLRPAEVVRVDLRDGARTTLQMTDRRRTRCRQFGLVPGGRYLYFAAPGVLILDRSDLSIVSDRPLAGIWPTHVAFSTDGASYSYEADAEALPSEVRTALPAGTTHVICVHDTRSGTVQWAVPLSR